MSNTITNSDPHMRAAFEREIAERPDDTAIQHQFADWLEENGHPEGSHHTRLLALSREGTPAVTPHQAWRAAIKASRETHKETMKSSKLIMHRNGNTAQNYSKYTAILSKGTQNEMYGEREPPLFNLVTKHHRELAQKHEQAGHHKAAEAHRIAALSHEVARATNWGPKQMEAARRARMASRRVYEGEERLGDEGRYRGRQGIEHEYSAFEAWNAANRAARPQGTLQAYRNAITHHQEAMEGSEYPELHRQAIAAHRTALRLKRSPER